MKSRYLKIFIAVLSVIVSVFALSACSASESDFYKDVDGRLDKVWTEAYTVLESLEKEEVYSYTLTVETEKLANFDVESRILPENKSPAEKKMWARTKEEYFFIKSGDGYYVKRTIIEGETDGNGLPVFSDKDYKKNVYKPAVVTEYLFIDGVLSMWTDGEKFDGQVILIGANAAVATLENSMPNHPAAFSANYRKWFGETVAAHSSYYIIGYVDGIAGANSYMPYRGSELAKGYGEDLQFDWESGVDIASRTASYTVKKGKITSFEYYTATFSANQKKTMQIWNNSEAIEWRGDKTEARSFNVTFNYPDKNNKIKLPSI
ncbi:MAG: hypothetical protein LBT55_05675 [Clostridiaceae bacterium]|jgi:hypothetical protein|nr:hypothetical protein [Clostridiaceae bacterium]